MTQESGLEARGRELFGPDGEPRTWVNTIPAATAPATVNIPDGPSGMGGSGLTNEYFNASWYELQVILNSGNHRHHDRTPVDWVYVIGQFLDLYRESRRPEPARLLLGVIKAMQSTDPRIGPGNRAQGWRPRQNVDPTIMVSETWAPVFQPVSSDARRAITESLLAAWLDKNRQYPLGQFFTPGVSEGSYAPPASLGRYLGRQGMGIRAIVPGGRCKSGSGQPASEMGNGLHRHGRPLSVFRWVSKPATGGQKDRKVIVSERCGLLRRGIVNATQA